MSLILSIDQGTTGTTAALIEIDSLKLIEKVNLEFPQIFPRPGWVEHNLNDIWKTVENTIINVLSRSNRAPKDISCIGITNQRETICAFDPQGQPLGNALVWQDRRTQEFCQQLSKMPEASTVMTKTGLTIDPYFSASKMKWLLENNSDIQKAAQNNQLRWGNIDTFLLFKLTNGNSHATEASNASRTLLMDLETADWDHQLLEIFNINSKHLPEIKNSIGDFGVTQGLNFLPDGIPITGILGDQQAALFGQAGYEKGAIKCTYGTGAFMLLNTGEDILRSHHGLLTTVAYRMNNKNVYALEGSCYIAGAAVQWLRDQLQFFPSSPEIEKIASQVKNLDEMEHILFLPFFTGLGSPYWKSNAKATIAGLTRDTNISHLSRACLDGIALSINDLINAIQEDGKMKLAELRVDGGAVANNLLMETQATVSDLRIIRPQIIETTAYGAALAAAIGADKLSLSEIKSLWQEDRAFDINPNWTPHYKKKKDQWKDAIKRLYL